MVLFRPTKLASYLDSRFSFDVADNLQYRVFFKV